MVSSQGKSGPKRWRWLRTLVLHFRPTSVPERTLSFTLTWGLGGMAVVLVLLLAGTGLLLKFAYQPSPSEAYASVLALSERVPFGRLLRNIHHWSANALVMITFLHLLRVFFTGAFLPPRQINWIIGLALMLLVLLSNLTGYLLPWDQLSFWAVTVCTSMLEYVPWVGDNLRRFLLGGEEVGAATLTGFYALHTAVLPISLATLLSYHFWRVRKAKGVVIPRAPGEAEGVRGESVPAVPNLLLREGVLALVVVAVVLLWSALVDAPLGHEANPGLSPNPTKAPWYFVGMQELLIHFHPLFAVVVLPALTVLAAVALPFVAWRSDTSGVWFVSHSGRRLGLGAAVAAIVVTPLAVGLDERGSGSSWLAACVLLAAVLGAFAVLKRRFSSNEAVQTISIFLLVAFLLLTFVGWLRGPDMALPWLRG